MEAGAKKQTYRAIFDSLVIGEPKAIQDINVASIRVAASKWSKDTRNKIAVQVTEDGCIVERIK